MVIDQRSSDRSDFQGTEYEYFHPAFWCGDQAVYWGRRGGPGKASGLKNRNPWKGSSGIGYISVPDPSSATVREDEFAKQSRLARYLAGARLGRRQEVERWIRESEASPSPKSFSSTIEKRLSREL
jgi:hypothetical protein